MLSQFPKRIGKPPRRLSCPQTVNAGLDAFDLAAMAEGSATGKMRRKMAVTADPTGAYFMMMEPAVQE